MKRKPIDPELLKKWKVIMYDITLEDVRLGTGLSKPTIMTALNDGLATQNSIDALSKYFSTVPAI